MKFKASGILILLAAMLAAFPAHAQQPDCTPKRDLLKIPEIQSDKQSHILKATVILSDEQRSLAGISATGASICNLQHVRMFKGSVTGHPEPWPSTGDILPGPTLRAHVGDLVELTFMNQVNPKNFPNTLDQDEEGKTAGCDVATGMSQGGKSVQVYPRATLESGPPWKAPPWTPPGKTPVPGDTYPNCLHGSSTANIHYHGTHTTPSTTGDNVLLFIHPALRDTGQIEPSEDFVNQQFGEFFKWCEKNGPPAKWEQLPPEWQQRQKDLLIHYDKTAPYKGVPGALPLDMQLWPKDQEELAKGLWPQYSIGAFPYCFQLPSLLLGGKKYEMYQSPGTHWYHAHKHGSTALNVGNGMTGALIIEGQYDDSLKNFYKTTPEHKNWGLEEQVLVIQQLETALNLLSPTNKGAPPPLSVNGRLNPIVKMKPNQVQMWRIVNGAARNFVEFDHFTTHGPGNMTLMWRQIAQDGVQFKFENYQRFGKVNSKFNLSPANRADLLVKAPSQEADYELQIVVGVSDVPSGTPITLLTVRVKNEDNQPISPPMDFITEAKDFPVFPTFLADINGPFARRPVLDFNTDPSSGRSGKGYLPRHTINNKLFSDHHIDQEMIVNTVEEWKLVNKTTNIAHPFHIHINPFQIVEVFQPNSPEAKDPGNKQCYADPTKPATWKPCHPIAPPWVWWDTFSIPTARNDTLNCTQQSGKYVCPGAQGSACAANSSGQQQCTVNIPGYFKMRSRFADFTGEFVLHCHILAHEDRGMMELVAVFEKGKAKNTSEYSHH